MQMTKPEPTESCTRAWFALIKTKAEANRLRANGRVLLSCTRSPEKLDKGTTMTRLANRMELRALNAWRTALKADYGTRYRIVWQAENKAVVWVRPLRALNAPEIAVAFNRSLRLPPTRQHTPLPKTYREAINTLK